MDKKILIIIGAIAYNRGSEALLTVLVENCKRKYKDSIITVAQAENDYKHINISKDINRYTKILNYRNNGLCRYMVGALRRIGISPKIIAKLKYSKLNKIAKEQDLIIVVGADNVDANIAIQKDTRYRNLYLKNNTKAKMILYDCSLDEKNVTNELKEDLKNFDIITARDSISFKNLSSIAGEKEILYFPDPAFLLSIQSTVLPNVFNNTPVVGINASNIVAGNNNLEKAKVINQYNNMINYILKNTNMNIVLIPHVMKNQDLEVLREIYKKYTDNNRINLIDNEKLNAKQLKYIISKCNLYVGARTHSTIASYSTNVPTLVLGYSIKSKGIAKDIFGTYENYVLPVSEMESNDYLVEGFKWLYNNQKEIKNILEKKMPEYLEKCKKFNEIL